jgi:hypothetical protein
MPCCVVQTNQIKPTGGIPASCLYCTATPVGLLSWGQHDMKRIPLTQGKFAIVDDEDYDWLMTWKWCVHHPTKNTFYAVSSWCSPQISMHRLLMRYPNNGLLVDHLNGDGLDNRKHNLRVCTHRENLQNMHTKRASKFPGVSFNKKRGKWTARITRQERQIHLGYFEHELLAAAFYHNAWMSIKHNKEIVVRRPSFTSKHKGVCFEKRSKRWCAYYTPIKGSRKWVGSFKTEQEAIDALHKERIRKQVEDETFIRTIVI